MISFSLEKVCGARGIIKPYRFLTKSGFSPTTATKLVNGDIEYIRLEYIEIICGLLNCTPNDLFVWVPNSKSDDSADHPLQAIRKTENIDLTATLQNLPMGKLKEVEALLLSIR